MRHHAKAWSSTPPSVAMPETNAGLALALRRATLTRGSHAVSSVGERLNIHALTYHPGIMHGFDTYARQAAPGFAARLVEVFGPVRYLDVGAGTGRFAEALRAQGVHADACEYSALARKLSARRGLKMFPFDLEASPVGPSSEGYAAAFSLEVAEHVPPQLGDRLVDYLTQFPTVVFTAAHPGQGGIGHINEQPQEYWARRFTSCGHRRRPDLEARFLACDAAIPHDWLTTNLMVYSAD